MKFLVVDDEPEVRRLLRDNIRLWGHEVALADSGAECLALCASDPPDILVLDVAMPDQDGPGVVNALRANGSEPPHVVLVSAVPVYQLRTVADELGVAYLPKPFDVRALEECFARLLER